MSHHPQSDQQANGTLSTLLLSGKSLRIGLKFFGPGFFVPAINPSLRLSEAAIQADTRSQQLSLSLSATGGSSLVSLPCFRPGKDKIFDL
ncbi:hypothetical protein ACFX13_015890 [Malus domestica]